MRHIIVASFLVGVLLAGCATVPSGPSVMVLPGTGKSFEQFQADDIVCRQWAGAGQLGGTVAGASGSEGSGYAGQLRYDMTYMQCMYAKGNQIPVSRGSEPAYTPPPPAPLPRDIPSPPAGAPPPPPPGSSR